MSESHSSSTPFPEEALKKLIVELSLRRRLLGDIKRKHDDESKRNMELRQILEMTRENLKVAYQQIDILKETTEKLQNPKTEKALDQRVAYEAKNKETVALRQQNLKLEIVNGKLQSQLEELKCKNHTLTESESTLKGKYEETNRTMELFKSQLEMMTKDHEKIMNKSESLQEDAMNVKISVEFYEKTTADLQFEKEKLQEQIGFLTNEQEELKKKLNEGSEYKMDQNNELKHVQTILKCKENELDFEIKKNSNLQLALARAIENGKLILLQKQELETQLMKLNERVESELRASKNSVERETQTDGVN